MAKSTFTLLGIFLVMTIATAAIVPEPIPEKNVTKRSNLINSVKKIGGSVLDTVDGVFDFLGTIFTKKYPMTPVPFDPIFTVYPTPGPFDSIFPKKQPKFVTLVAMNELRNAIRSWNDEKVTELLMGGVNFFHREYVAAGYYQQFSSDMKSDIKMSFSGPYRDLLVAFVENKYEFLAEELHDGIYNQNGGNLYAPLDVLCNPHADQITNINKAYESKYGREVTSDLANISDLSLSLSLKFIARGQRTRDFFYDPSQVNLVGYERDDPLFNELLCLHDTPRFFADRLYACLVNHDYRGLTRLIIKLINLDIFKSVTAAYQELYKQSLSQAVLQNTSGPYSHALWRIIDMASFASISYDTNGIPSLLMV